MPKLAKNMWTNSKGERKLNCYVCNIPKEVVSKTDILENDEIKVYSENNKIIIEKSESDVFKQQRDN